MKNGNQKTDNLLNSSRKRCSKDVFCVVISSTITTNYNLPKVMNMNSNNNNSNNSNNNNNNNNGNNNNNNITSLIDLPSFSLVEAAKFGQLRECVAFVEKIRLQNPHADLSSAVNSSDDSGNTPLHWACYKKNYDIVKYLISMGGNPNQPNTDEGQTPFHWACIGGDPFIVKYVLNSGGDPFLQDRRGYNSLIHASQYGEMKIVRYLLEKGVGLMSRDQLGQTALHWAAYQGHIQLILFLVNKGAELDALDTYGRTALHWACYKGHKDPIKALADFGGNLLTKDTNGDTPIDLCRQQNHTYLARTLAIYPHHPLRKLGPDFLSAIENELKVPEVCSSCLINKPIRSRHCRTCKRCVARFDHHCGWINNCVGANNNLAFIMLLALFTISYSLSMVLNFKYLALTPDAPAFLSFFSWLTFHYAENKGLLVLISYESLIMAWISRLFYVQVTGVMNNVTMFELMRPPTPTGENKKKCCSHNKHNHGDASSAATAATNKKEDDLPSTSNKNSTDSDSNSTSLRDQILMPKRNNSNSNPYHRGSVRENVREFLYDKSKWYRSYSHKTIDF
ncbi:Ankyrin repeat-containing protein [Heterostelium album PN500]|uniref:Palmitoyltransferase n=1 Tax=Heterostelium pallidum (strain ATCC 26659 / Pp 5 / PN500) TaxID=670386 RepID=D3BGI1_HETP5|nr:Ankyrin repeat-containing protein [Heterostelium album PN500]EFA79581.1 Ankyrin repeat-containing protein [Heterostelium album PN500]|eukprot:XP_020431702.1 Ankyrin repeat-containing protein [Heterostelium album PN500]